MHGDDQKCRRQKKDQQGRKNDIKSPLYKSLQRKQTFIPHFHQRRVKGADFRSTFHYDVRDLRHHEDHLILAESIFQDIIAHFGGNVIEDYGIVPVDGAADCCSGSSADTTSVTL